ncbi:MAG: HDOD domain-containing protein [Desulfobacterales bacterium]
MDEKKLEAIVGRIRSVPAMPATAARLLPLLSDPAADARRVEEVLRHDPGLTADLLKIANSAYFGLPARVGSVRQAVLLLGWKRLLQLVMTLSMSGLMRQPLPGYDLPRGALWRHSVAVSVAAERLIALLKIPDGDAVFTAALLHDVGKIVLAQFVREELGRIEALVGKGLSFDVAETVVLGVNHAEIGGKVLEAWALPPGLVEAVRLHHDPERCARDCPVSDLVHVANAIGGRLDAEERGVAPPEASPEVLDRLGLGGQDFAEVTRRTRRELTRLSEAL